MVLDDITIEMWETFRPALIGLPGQIRGMGRLFIDAYMYIFNKLA